MASQRRLQEQLGERLLCIDLDEYPVRDLGKVLGILWSMIMPPGAQGGK
jgi:hypothetical protein